MGFVLNDRQQQAIEHVHGPMLVVAGAGTGKTTELARRVARLISDGYARADEILAVTYTEAAAEHLKRKVSETLSEAGVRCDAGSLQAGTIHAYGNALLTQAGRGFGVVDDTDLWVLLRRRIKELPLKLYLPARDPGEFLNALKEFFSRCLDELVEAESYERFLAGLRAGKSPPPRVAPSKKDALLSPEERLARCAEIAAVFRTVEEILAAGKMGTFGHMITGAVRLLREDTAALREAQKKARFILIDEFQDANIAQIELLRLLAGEERNVFAVGDPDQAIYHFRGASNVAFEHFLRCFPGAMGAVLNQNQRSTSHILGCAHSVISENPQVDCTLAQGVVFHRERLVSAREKRNDTDWFAPSKPRPKSRSRRSGEGTLSLFAEAETEAEPLVPQPVSIVLGDKEREAADVAEEIRALVDDGDPGRIAVLYRIHAHAALVAYELAIRGVPAVVKGVDALETPEGRDFMAALGAVASLSNVDDLFRVSAFPMFGLDPGEVSKQLKAAGRDVSYATLLGRIPGGERVMQKVEAARAYAASVDWQAVPISRQVAREFGFDASTGISRRICDFIAAWRQKAVTETGELQELVLYVRYFQQAGGKVELLAEDENATVQLMTVHAAKGLEFDRVFVLRANRGSFPQNYREAIFEFPPALRQMPLDASAKELHEEEERRLFYVALTRARDFLSVHAKPGKYRGQPALPTGLLRGLMTDRDVAGEWTSRDARQAAVAQIHAAEAPQSGVAAWMLKPMIIVDPALSASAIDAFATCPLKYKLRNEWRNLPGPVSGNLIFGNIMHAVLRDIHQAELAGRARNEGQVLQSFEEQMAEARFDDPLQAQLYREQGARQLSEYFRLRSAGSALPVLAAENDFKVKIAGVLVRGRMDRVDQTAAGGRRIVDFKTGKPWDKDKADDSLQLGIYALAARALWGNAPAELVVYNMDDQSEIVSARHDLQLSMAERQVREVADAIAETAKAGDFPAQPGYHCTHCEYRGVCPEQEQRLYAISPTSAD